MTMIVAGVFVMCEALSGHQYDIIKLISNFMIDSSYIKYQIQANIMDIGSVLVVLVEY